MPKASSVWSALAISDRPLKRTMTAVG